MFSNTDEPLKDEYIHVYIRMDIYIMYIIYTELRGRGLKSHSDQLSIAASNNPSAVNTICISSFPYKHVITSRKLQLKQT